jgi:hypothetical protein
VRASGWKSSFSKGGGPRPRLGEARSGSAQGRGPAMGALRGQFRHAVITMRCRRVGAGPGPPPPAGRGTLRVCEGERRLPGGPGLGREWTTPHLSMPTPSVASSARPGGPGWPWLSSPFRSPVSMRTRASREKAVLSRRTAIPVVPLAHLDPASGVISPGRAKSPHSYTPLFSNEFAPPCTAPHLYYQRCWTPVAAPLPVTLRLDIRWQEFAHFPSRAPPISGFVRRQISLSSRFARGGVSPTRALTRVWRWLVGTWRVP